MKKFFLAMLVTCFTVVAVPVQAATFSEVQSLIKQHYVYDLPENFHDATTIDEMTAMLDVYSEYLSPIEYAQLQNSIDLQFGGIGIRPDDHAQGIYVTEVLEGSAAQQAGLVAGSIITQAANTPLAGLSFEEKLSYLFGEPGTVIELYVKQPTGQTVPLSITRQALQYENVVSELLYGNVGYISLNSFSYDASALMRQAFTELRQQGARSYIIDLRDNGGGYVTEAEKIIGMFTNSPIAYILQTKDKVYTQKSAGSYHKFPATTRVLMNENSASASEMTAAAIQDQQAATIYGTTSYGKGAMQQFFTFNDGSALKLTMAEFTGPNGNTIQHKGIIPDVETTSPLDDAHFDALAQQLGYTVQPQITKGVSSSLYIVHKQIATAAKDRYTLIQLGSNKEIAFHTVKSGKRYARLNLTENMKTGHNYALITHRTDNNTGKIQKITIE